MSTLHHRRHLLSLIVPTIGRPTLLDAITSAAWQKGSEDIELIVVADAHNRDVSVPLLADLQGHFGNVVRASLDAGYSAWGHPQRTHGMKYATGAWLAFLDDDDVWTPDALDHIRAALEASDARLHLFRMAYPNGRALWRTQRIEQGNVGTPMIVAANDQATLGQWSRRYEGDFDFIKSSVERLSDPATQLAWWPHVICEIEPSFSLTGGAGR
jgi:glycosyltransferase involved in cell wall biosynthesis